MDKQPAPAIS